MATYATRTWDKFFGQTGNYFIELPEVTDEIDAIKTTINRLKDAFTQDDQIDLDLFMWWDNQWLQIGIAEYVNETDIEYTEVFMG